MSIQKMSIAPGEEKMKHLRWIILGLLVFVLAACNGTDNSSSSNSAWLWINDALSLDGSGSDLEVFEAPPTPIPASVWIDAPLDGSAIPLAPYLLVFHGTSYTGISEFEIRVNGAAIDAVPPKSTAPGGSGYGALFYSDYQWTPPAPGSFLIAVQVKDGNNQFGPSAQALVIVPEEISSEEALPPDDASPPEELPPQQEEEVPSEPAVPMFDTAMFYYGGSCRPNQLRAEIKVMDPEAYSVVLFYRLRDMDSDTKTEWEAVAMNPGSDGYYVLTVASSSIPDREMFMSAYFQVQIVGTNGAGEEILRTDVVANQITLLACGEEVPEDADEPDDDAPPTVVPPECSDGVDNDGDGDTDMADGRCTSPEDDSESG